MTNIRSLIKQDVQFLVGESEMPIALGCLNASVNQLKLMSQGVKDFEIEKYTLDHYLRLDVAAINALNVFPQNNEVVAGSAGSLFGLLNNCKTQIGVRLLKKWLKQPTTREQDIETRLSIVEYFTQNLDVLQDLQLMYLQKFPDVEKLYSKFYRVQAQVKNTADLVDCVKVYNMVCTLMSLCNFLKESL